MTVHIRTLSKSEIQNIRNLALDIWPKTYAPILSPEQIDYMLHLFYSDEALLNDFSKPGYHFYILAVNGVDAGYAGIAHDFNHGNKNGLNRGQSGWHLHKIYLSQSFQGLGLGKKLLAYIEDVVKNNNGQYLTLNVNRFNKALHFYKACGYEIWKEEDTDIGNGFFMNDYVMRKKLKID